MSDVFDWRTRAACRRADPDLFFPEWTVGPAIDRAKQICNGCPVRARCLDWALSHGATFGIWGGRTAAERHAMGYPRNDQGPARGSTWREREALGRPWTQRRRLEEFSGGHQQADQ